MGAENKISEEVVKKLAEIEKKLPEIGSDNEALQNASRLADTYADIEPEPYILPLDSLSGTTASYYRNSK